MYRVFLWAVLVFAGIVPLRAAAETPWQDHQGMLRTRLVAASADMAAPAAGNLYAWEAELAPGWKTYWRSPGEAGLPVRLRADGAPVDILFPLPERFDLFGLETYGYGHKVMLPFRLQAGAQEVAVDFMVCKDICVPMEARYPVPETLPASSQDVRLAAWLARVPAREGGAGVGLRIGAVKLAGTPGHQRLVIDVAADVALSDADLLAEIDDMVHFGAPERRVLADGRSVRFVLTPMTGNKPLDLVGRTVRLTATDGHGHAIDRSLLVGRN